MLSAGLAEIQQRDGATVYIPQTIVDAIDLIGNDFEVEYFEDLSEFIEVYGDDAEFRFILISQKA